MAAPEFNAFTYWRPPPDELVEMEPDDDDEEEQDAEQQPLQQLPNRQQQQQQQEQKLQQKQEPQQKQQQFLDRRQTQPVDDVHQTRQRGRASLELRPHSGGSSDFRPGFVEAGGGSAWVASSSDADREASGNDSAPEAGK